MATHDGGCLCGRVRFRVTAEALDSGYCHCRMCQRNSGAPTVAWAQLSSARVKSMRPQAHSRCSRAALTP